jgi:hypothetical protein
MNLHFCKRLAPTATAGVLICAAPALGQEDARGSPTDVEFMDYVSVGKVIRLGPSQSVVLGYLTSCWREIIAGGTVTVGHGQSEVQGGSVTRTKVTCDGGRCAVDVRPEPISWFWPQPVASYKFDDLVRPPPASAERTFCDPRHTAITRSSL